MSSESVDDQPLQAIEILADLDKQLHDWKESIPVRMQPKSHLKQSQAFETTNSLHEIIMHTAYYDLVMVVHAPFAYPWMNKRFGNDLSTILRSEVDMQATKSAEAMVTVARNIIIMARNFEINGANTHA
jgi:hypothetical protein